MQRCCQQNACGLRLVCLVRRGRRCAAVGSARPVCGPSARDAHVTSSAGGIDTPHAWKLWTRTAAHALVYIAGRSIACVVNPRVYSSVKREASVYVRRINSTGPKQCGINKRAYTANHLYIPSGVANYGVAICYTINFTTTCCVHDVHQSHGSQPWYILLRLLMSVAC